jgi:hypothetical protein
MYGRQKIIDSGGMCRSMSPKNSASARYRFRWSVSVVTTRARNQLYGVWSMNPTAKTATHAA